MGTCQNCYPDPSTEEIKTVKTLNLKAGPEFNAINFSFTNRPLTDLQGDCLVFYADHVKELAETVALNSIHRKTKRKIYEYLNCAEQQTEINHMRHYLIPISIPEIRFKYMMLVKIQPWDGVSKQHMQKRIFKLTVGYLQSFKLRQIKDFTIVEFDSFSGIHYSMSFPPISKALQDYCSDIHSVNLLCNSVESVDYFYRKIRYYNEGDQHFAQSKGQRQEKGQEKQKNRKRKKAKKERISMF